MRYWSYFFLVAALSAQTQSSEISSHEEEPTFQSSVNLVRVPVVVRDKAGHTVGGLQKSDFRLMESGKPQEIAQFVLEGSAAAKPPAQQSKPGLPGEAAAEAKPVAPTRFVAFVFDDVHLSNDELQNIRIAVLKHIEHGLAPEERVAILTLSGNVALELTDDLAKFRETLAKIAAIPKRTHFPPASFYMAEQFMRNSGDESLGCTSTPTGLVTCDARMPPILTTQIHVTADCLHLNGFQIQEAPPIARATLRAVYNEGAGEAFNCFHTLNNIVRLLGSMPGDRIMILVSPGIYLPDEMQRNLNDSIDRATRSGVIINTLDARGVYTIDPSVGVEGCTLTEPTTQQQLSTYDHNSITLQGLILGNLADSTGGTALSGNDFADEFNRLGNPPEHVYYLGYYPKALKPDGKYHEIKVTLANGQGLSIRARKGYWAPTHAENPAEASTREIGEAVFSRDELSDLPLSVDTRFYKATPTDAKLRVTTHLDLHRLRLRKADDRNDNDVTVVCALFDSNGNYLKGFQKVVALRLKDENVERLRNVGLTVNADFDVKPGGYMVRLVARDAEGLQMATANAAVAIP